MCKYCLNIIVTPNVRAILLDKTMNKKKCTIIKNLNQAIKICVQFWVFTYSVKKSRGKASIAILLTYHFVILQSRKQTQ